MYNNDYKYYLFLYIYNIKIYYYILIKYLEYLIGEHS